MDKALYVGMSAATQNMLAQAINANNLANASTTGFRADLAQARALQVAGDGYASRAYTQTEMPTSDFAQGPLRQTGNDMDIALQGDGWIAVLAPDGSEAFSRAGELTISPLGEVRTVSGLAVLGNAGPIALPPFEKLEIGNVFPIEMPSLRERAEDIPHLLNELITRLEGEKRGSVRFSKAAIESLCRHSWPGNVRELANLVERMAILHPNSIVGVGDLPAKFRHLTDEELLEMENLPEQSLSGAAQANGASAIAGNGAAATASNGTAQALLPLNGLDLKKYLATLERDLIDQALNDAGGVVARAADRLNIRRTTLVEKMRKYDMHRRTEGLGLEDFDA